MKNEKEYLYIGHYIDTLDNYILKVGTTSNLARRLMQHNKFYPTAVKNPMKKNEQFSHDWFIKLSHANTLKYEASFKEAMRMIGENYVQNDRFIFNENPKKIFVTIKKTYEVAL